MQELSLHILDVAHNAITAKSTLIEIFLRVDFRKDCLTIIIQDNGCGMTPTQLSLFTDPFYTTRTTRKVGLGIPLLKLACELSDGELTARSQPNKGTTVTACFGLSHVNTMPIGDMAQTICTLIQLGPDIDIVFHYIIDNREFVMDTRQFRSALGEVALNAPMVLSYVRAYISEKIENIVEVYNNNEKHS